MLVIKPENYKDVGAFAGIEGIEDVKQAKEKIILYSLNVLMKRGIEGLYIYASDDALRERLLELQSENLKK
ncbi:DNA/RNA helicase domain-containing protein [Lysinibacillus zambalensis]|uniref:DNA/RNA helicase domain-containing protein n=1 Tax=Lysinibacillus zambalensis TaxID=3160866 RepID=UPI003D80A42A